MSHSYDKPFNICTATYWSAYCETEDEVREITRSHGFRFVDKGGADSEYIDNPRGISGEMITRRTDESVNVFHLFRDEDDFAGFLPVTRDELRIALDTLKAFREPAPMVPHAEYGALHPLIQNLYRGVFNPEMGHQDFYLRDPDEVAA